MLYSICARHPQHKRRSHNSHSLQPVDNVGDKSDSLTSGLNILKYKDRKNSFNRNASKLQQKTSLCASTMQNLTTISTKILPLFLPFSYKKAITNTSLFKTKSSLTSTSTALTATNNLIPSSFSPIASQDNSFRKHLFTLSHNSSPNMFNNNVSYDKPMPFKHLPRKYKFIMHLIAFFLIMVMQIGFATADQGKLKKKRIVVKMFFV